jgi:hypothetical protein
MLMPRILGTNCDFGEFNGSYLDENLMAVVISLYPMIQKYQVTFDRPKENAFLLHTDCDISGSSASPKGLYVYEPPESYEDVCSRQ